tara:strand:+ start:98 stop:319 length:222 start_codon:yes stop_codon:yes gene_type:complete
MSRIRQHYQGYITDLLRKIEVCDRMYVETGQVDWLYTYDMLSAEVGELKTTVKQMERYNETYFNQSSEEESSK